MVQRVQSLRSSTKNARPTTGSREAGEIYTNYPDKQLGVIDAAKAPMDLIAVRFFSATTDYAAGDFVVNAGVGYQAKVNITAAAFNPTQWNTISTALDLSGKENTINPGTTAQYWRGDKSWQTLDKTAVGLSNVDNTADANKPVSSAQATADAARVAKIGDTMSGHLTLPTGPGAANAVRKDYVDLADAALTNALALKAPIDSPVLTGDPRAPTPNPGDNDTSIATTAFVTAAIGTNIGDAPADTNAYGRRNGSWVDVAEEAPSDSTQYVRKNGAWTAVAVPPGTVISDTPPASPVAGALWLKSDSFALYIWYTDVDSSAWVQINFTPSSGRTAEARNRIVNGGAQISQENGLTVGTTNGYYLADNWLIGITNVAGISVNQNTAPGSSGPVYRLRIASTTADTTIAGSDALYLHQRIEGSRINDFKWGTVDAKPAVLRFTVWTNVAGTYSVSLRDSPTTVAWIGQFTIAAGEASTWVERSIAIPATQTGTWSTDNTIGAILGFTLVAGPTLTGINGWQAGNILAGPGQVNWMATANSIINITNVGLHLDPLATGLAPPWQMPDEAQETLACMRYWQTVRVQFSGNVTSASTYYATASFLVPPRTLPSFSGVNVAASSFPATVGSLGNANQVQESRAASATALGRFVTDVTCNARL